METNFEGPEKKLEIILYSPHPGLRATEQWHKVVRASGSYIVSRISNEYMDAYLLSESSLFVWDDSILMITCGRTSIVNSLSEILGIVDKDEVAYAFYERKNFVFPGEQPSDFEEDAKRLLDFFQGKSYRMGPANDDHLHVFYAAGPNAVPEPDATFQVLMNELDPSVMKMFSSANTRTPELTAVESGLREICPGLKTIDCHQFHPYGYSLNGIMGSNYYTVHVTPQPEGSYTSFETNIIEKDYSGVISRVISIFRPGRFSIVLTTSRHERFMPLHGTVAGVLPNYDISERSTYEFDSGYMVTFLNYIKKPG